MKFEKDTLVKILNCCIKDDCSHCPNAYKDGRATCGDFARGSVHIPLSIMRETINALTRRKVVKREYQRGGK